MEFYIVLAQTLAIILAIFMFKRWTTQKKEEGVHGENAPEPPGAWPVIGHLPLLASASQPHRAFASLAKRHGPAFTIRMGLKPYLVVSSRDAAKECYTTNDRAFATRPCTIAGKLMAYDHAVMGFTPFGPFWRETRKIATTELYSARRIETLRHVRSSEVGAWVRELYGAWAAEKSAGSSVGVEMKGQLEELTSNVLLRMVAGKRYFGAGVREEDKEMARRFRRAVEDFNHYLATTGAYDALPFLEWFDLKGDAKAMRKTQTELDYIMQSWVDEHRRRRGGVDPSKAGDDFIDVLLATADGGQFTSSMSDTDTAIKALALTQLVAGVDSMANTMVWALALLLKNPHVLERVQEELDVAVGRERHVDESDIPNLTLLQAVVKETMRLYPVGPLLVPHEAMEDCHVAGYFVPRGTGLFVNAWTIHRDPHVWEDPDRFLPDRFLVAGRQEDVDVRGQSFELLPFGSGRRACPGSGLALRVVYITLARVLQAYELKTLPDVGVDMEEGFGLLLYKLNPLWVQIAPRLTPGLYE